MATKVYQLKSTVIKNEFHSFLKGLDDIAPVVKQLPNKTALQQNLPSVEALLLNHPYINDGFYILVNGQDTLQSAVRKQGDHYEHLPLQQYQLQLLAASGSNSNAIVNIADSLHWLTISKYQLADSSVLIAGLDINLRQLQHHLWSVDTTGRAYAFITDQQGVYISHPEEQLIGEKMLTTSLPVSGRKRLGDSITSYETVTSSYLQLPVLRYYTPLQLAGTQWTLVVDTPLLAVDEDVKAIEKYMLLLFISTGIIILALIAWAQTKWQKEFVLRQQAELTRKELLAEKQTLGLIAEKQQKHNALLQLNTLKDKVDPHFLFNSLNSLNALIEQSPELAKSFVMKLSHVYRYVLDAYPDKLTTVAAELHFANEYFFLLKIRFGQALAPLEIQISDEHMQRQVPFVSLQTLIENAVKHNIVSKEMPLQISIQSEDDHIVITNNLQLRKDVKGSGNQGLYYLQSIYSYLGNQQFRYGVEGSYFKCYLPVLPASK
ncbi:histidine kinase [Chitinophaga tropicalis]|nr:histidine kinase [Chitinophaga tropicalis]